MYALERMRSIIQFTISHEDDIYTAEGVNAPIVTEARTFEELQDNIRDAAHLFLRATTRSRLASKSPRPFSRISRSPH